MSNIIKDNITCNDMLQCFISRDRSHGDMTDMMCRLNCVDARIHERFSFLTHNNYNQETMDEINELRPQHLDIRRRVQICIFEINLLMDYNTKTVELYEYVLNILNDFACGRR